MGKTWEDEGDQNHHVAGTDEYIEPSLGERDNIPESFAVCSDLMTPIVQRQLLLPLYRRET